MAPASEPELGLGGAFAEFPGDDSDLASAAAGSGFGDCAGWIGSGVLSAGGGASFSACFSAGAAAATGSAGFGASLTGGGSRAKSSGRFAGAFDADSVSPDFGGSVAAGADCAWDGGEACGAEAVCDGAERREPRRKIPMMSCATAIETELRPARAGCGEAARKPPSTAGPTRSTARSPVVDKRYVEGPLSSTTIRVTGGFSLCLQTRTDRTPLCPTRIRRGFFSRGGPVTSRTSWSA